MAVCAKNYMIWNDWALNENMRIWKREQTNPEALWEVKGGALKWWQLLQEAVRVAGERNVEMPPIYFHHRDSASSLLLIVSKCLRCRFAMPKLSDIQ